MKMRIVDVNLGNIHSIEQEEWDLKIRYNKISHDGEAKEEYDAASLVCDDGKRHS